MAQFKPFPLTHAGAGLVGQMIRPEGEGPFPAVLVMYSAYGLGPHVKHAAERLAAQGYLALCTDMYGGGAYYPNPAEAGGDFAAIMARPELLRERCRAWFDALAAHPLADPARIAAIGYCFGGKCVLELARSGADAKAVVSFHGVLTTHAPAAPGAFRGEVAAWCGAQDPYAPLADIDALRGELEAAGASYQIHTLGEVAHSFTDPDAAKAGRPGIAYDARADRLSWAGTLALLEDVFA
jgi:dienelactone hydrolase